MRRSRSRPASPSTRRRSMRHPSGRYARCRRSAPIFRAPRSSVGEAPPRDRRRRTSIATRAPYGSRAKRSTSRRPRRRLRVRIAQPTRANELAASASAAWPTRARRVLPRVTPEHSASGRTFRVFRGYLSNMQTRRDRGIGFAMVRRHAERIKSRKMNGCRIPNI